MNPIPRFPQSRFTVQAPNFTQAPLATTLDGIDEVGTAHGADSLDRLVELIIANQIVPLSPIDEVVVIEDALTAVRIEVVSGADAGQQGWIPAAWLHAIQGAHADDPESLSAAAA